MREKVIAMVMDTPWHMGYNALQSGVVSTIILVGLLSDEWVNDYQINCMADAIHADMQTFGVDASTQLASAISQQIWRYREEEVQKGFGVGNCKRARSRHCCCSTM
jgi:hypothetical protein